LDTRALERPPGRSRSPRGGDWLQDEVTAWQRAGLSAVVSLLENDEAAQLDLAHEGGAVESAGLRFMSFPIPDRGVPASTRQALSPLGSIAAALEQGKNVAVHCRPWTGNSGDAGTARMAQTLDGGAAG
jgi:hypothetical protein